MLQEYGQRGYKLQKKTIHISTHMFFENAEVKQKWQSILNDFAFKSGANKKAFQITSTLNKKENEKICYLQMGNLLK